MSFKTPVLYIVFNRLDTVRRTFPRIAACQPEALEIARKGAVGLAAVGHKLLSDEAFRAEADEYHRNQIPDFYKK